MKVTVLDTFGLKCPQPVLKIAVKAPDMNVGEILEVWGDCPTFEKDIRYSFKESTLQFVGVPELMKFW
jgi:tRNA 2-thiouridine synthesizing protein A